MTQRDGPTYSLGGVIATGAFALLAVIMFHTGVGHRAGYEFTVGTVHLPVADTGAIYALWFLFGLVVTLCVARLTQVALLRFGLPRPDSSQLDDRQLLLLAMLVGFAIPWLLRFFVFQDAPIVDDESAYLFSSQLLADGQLTGTSHPFKLFYDRAFLINDGQTYTQYFLGWPLLMLPGTLLGMPELMNPLYSALTLPPLFWLLRRLTTRGWAWVGVGIWLVSPFMQLSAATLMAHTSCAMTLMWGLWLAFRATDDDATHWHHAGLAFAFSLAFLIRPATALGIAIAPVIFWFAHLVRRGLGERRQLFALGAFCAVAVVMAAAFLGINAVQNGGPFSVSYQAAYAYAKSNEFRFSMWPGEVPGEVRNFRFDRLPIYVTGVGLYRLFISALGWPLTLVFAFIGGFHRHARVFLGSAAGMVLVLMFSSDAGVDPVGPAHYTELMVPLVILVTLAFSHITRWEVAVLGEERRLHLAGALLAGSLVAGLTLFVPVRVATLHDYSAPMAAVLDIHDDADVDRKAVVFAPAPLLKECATAPSRHFAFWRPFNEPDLENDVVWVNHITVELDRKLMTHSFPDRDGFVLAWVEPCKHVLVPLDAPPRVIGNLPDARLPDGTDLDDLREQFRAAEAPP